MSKGFNNKITLALAYTDQFDYPLTKQEIFLRLIGVDSSISFNKFSRELEKLVLNKKVLENRGLYFLKGSENNVEKRLKRQKFSLKKWREVEEFIDLVRLVPWVSGAAVTGSLSVNNAKKNDDIDFLVVTEKNRLWLSRVFVVLLLFLKGKKRSWNGDEDNSWCLNFWLDDTSLKLPKRLHNIYGAFEVCQAVWVYDKYVRDDKKSIKNKFFELNIWARQFLNNYFDFQKGNAVWLKESSVSREIISKNKISREIKDILGRILDIINSILFFTQYLYMKPHMTSEKVSENFAFFHPRDTKKQVLGRWLKRIKTDE